MQETIDFLETHFISEKSLPFGKQKWDAWQKVKEELAQLSHNSGSTQCRFFSREKICIGATDSGENCYQSVPWCNHEPSQRAIP